MTWIDLNNIKVNKDKAGTQKSYCPIAYAKHIEIRLMEVESKMVIVTDY